MIGEALKVFLPITVSFFIGICLSPILTHYLYKYKAWKKKAGKIDAFGSETPIFNELHKEREVSTPRLGGIIIWASAIITALIFWSIARIFPLSAGRLDFISRNQTWIPLATLIVGAIIGMIDDIFEIRGNGCDKGGLSLKKRILVVLTVGLLCGMWFYFKLGVMSISIPFLNELYLGYFIIPFFALVMLFIYSGGVIDGIDGLAGGVFAVSFSAYGAIAFMHGQIDLAAFCGVIVGGLLSFLWFNIPPARFYMSETGTMALTITLTVVAFMTDKVEHGYGLFVLPLIALPLVITSLSNIIQMISRKFFGRKIFLVAPLHHHFEALGWPSYKVTMRYWVISVVFGILGFCIALIASKI
ncbi:MAG: hypothetical protein WCF92_01765 [bacterium]